jgi:MFS family permease
MVLSGRLTQRIGAGRTSLLGGVILGVGTIPFVLVTSTTSFALIGVAMAIRGIGIGLAIMPAMTAAFSVLTREQVNDATPQLTVLQRVGGSLGTAIIAVVLEGQTRHAHSAAAAAVGFGHTYWWVMGATLIGLLPTLLLARIEHRAKTLGQAPVSDPATEPLLEAA